LPDCRHARSEAKSKQAENLKLTSNEKAPGMPGPSYFRAPLAVFDLQLSLSEKLKQPSWSEKLRQPSWSEKLRQPSLSEKLRQPSLSE
jgi:hypothetical protein